MDCKRHTIRERLMVARNSTPSRSRHVLESTKFGSWLVAEIISDQGGLLAPPIPPSIPNCEFDDYLNSSKLQQAGL
jgi:hypothetical protein